MGSFLPIDIIRPNGLADGSSRKCKKAAQR
jgi:hypothetical protein